MEPQAECMLVVIGATPEGKKELVGFQVGMHESSQSWRELLVGIKARGLASAPEIAVGDGALGFWKAVDEVFPGTRHQRCFCGRHPSCKRFPPSERVIECELLSGLFVRTPTVSRRSGVIASGVRPEPL